MLGSARYEIEYKSVLSDAGRDRSGMLKSQYISETQNEVQIVLITLVFWVKCVIWVYIGISEDMDAQSLQGGRWYSRMCTNLLVGMGCKRDQRKTEG